MNAAKSMIPKRPPNSPTPSCQPGPMKRPSIVKSYLLLGVVLTAQDRTGNCGLPVPRLRMRPEVVRTGVARMGACQTLAGVAVLVGPSPQPPGPLWPPKGPGKP